MAKILVTGATGFVGGALLPALTRERHDVVALTRSEADVANPIAWSRLPPVEHVIHLAARSFVPESWRDPESFLRTNVQGTVLALNYARSCGAHVVFVSGYVYGQPRCLPIHEDDPAQPNNPYALSKLLAEQVCAFYSSHMGIPVTVIRPFNIYGPGQRPEFLIPTILDQVTRHINVCVDDLAPRRDYVFVTDVVAALIASLERPAGYRLINIGSGVSYSVRDVIDAILDAAGLQLPVISKEKQRPEEIAEVRADISRARSILGWQPRTSFAEGIAQLVRANPRDAPSH